MRPSKTGDPLSIPARMSPGTHAHKQPRHLRPDKKGKDAIQKSSTSLGVIPRVLPSIETSTQTSPNSMLSELVTEVLEKVSRRQLSLGRARGIIVRLCTRSHTQILGSDDLGSRPGTSRYKDQAIQTEHMDSRHDDSRDLQSKTNWSMNTKATDDSGYLSWRGPSDIRDEDPSSSWDLEIDEGSGQRHVLRAKANIRNTHRLQVSSQESGIDAKKLSLPRIVDVGNDSRSSFSSPQRLSSSSKEKSMESTPCTRPSTGTESPSDGSTPSLSNNSEDNLTTAILANYATEQIATDVTRYFMEIVRSKFGFRQRGPSSSQEQHRSSGQPSQPSQDICREASQRGRQCLSNDRKRPRQSNGDDEDSDRAPDDKTPESKRRKFAEADKPKIACPFMKHSPTEFSAWRTCIGPGFDGMNRMKYVH